MTGFALVVSLGLSVALFILLPSALTDLLRKVTGSVPVNSREVWLLPYRLSKVSSELRSLFHIVVDFSQQNIKRIWMYHGSEHKTIAAYEAGLPLTVGNIRPMSRFHPRCGTSFLFW